MLLFPHAQFWVLGHSLGGVVASLLGTTFGLPTVTFESPADRMVLNRLGLAGESRRGSEVVTQVFHTVRLSPSSFVALALPTRSVDSLTCLSVGGG